MANHVMEMHTADSFFDTKADVSFLNSALILLGWRKILKKKSRPNLQTTTKQPLHTEELTMLQLRLGDL